MPEIETDWRIGLFGQPDVRALTKWRPESGGLRLPEVALAATPQWLREIARRPVSSTYGTMFLPHLGWKIELDSPRNVTTMMDQGEGLATAIAATLARAGKVDQALDWLYRAMRLRLAPDRLEEARELLTDAATRADLPISALLALLTITRAHRKEFEGERGALVRVVERRDPPRAERLLRGLR